MCKHLDVSRGGFYAWQKRLPSLRQLDDQALVERVREVHQRSRAIYGAPRVTHNLRQQGVDVGQRRVARLMRMAQLQGRSARLYRRSRTGQKAFFKSVPNCQHEIEPHGINQIWVGDVTYLKVRHQWRYLAVVMDKFSRRVVSWSLSPQRDADLTSEAMRLALRHRQPDSGLIFHSDRGIEYAAHRYKAVLHRGKVVQSMNRPGRMNDNAHMESFFHSLKSEFLYGKTFDTDQALRQTLAHFMQFYNHQRLHTSIGHLAPAAFERSLLQQTCVN
jgi:transposase InsO family protein